MEASRNGNGTFSRSTTMSDDDYDDNLDVPPIQLTISDEGKPVVIEHEETDYNTEVAGKIPYTTIYTGNAKFKSYQRRVFVLGLDVNVTIEQSDRNLTSHFLNPNLYIITLTHGNFTWQVKKRYKHIQNLHQQLILFKTSLNIPFPTKTHRQRRDNFRQNSVVDKSGRHKAVLPRFPKKPEVLVSFDRIPQRIKQLEDYLNNLLAIKIYRNHPETILFFELSHLSFIHDLGIKGHEGMVKKRLGNSVGSCKCLGLFRGNFCIRCKHLCNDVLWSTWSDRWFFIKEQCFGYIHPKTGRIGNIILFDQGFEVSSGLRALGLQTGVQIETFCRQLVINCWTRRKCKEWMRAFKEIAHNQAKDFTQYNPRNSFAPVRSNINATWFVDGAGYMSAIADALHHAKEEIFIADWWLSPEIYLKRPAIRGDYWRLDKVLQRKAEEGVRVFVLLYKEVEMAIGINSFYSKQRLVRGGNDNIKVIRHPQHAKSGVFLWAHHEKLVVVDQSIAFVGGIDLCYGRWDDSKHRLTDLGSLSLTALTPTKRKKTSSSPSGDFPLLLSRSSMKLYIPDLIIDPPLSENHRAPESFNRSSTSNKLLSPPKQKEFFKGSTPEFEKKSFLLSIKQGIKSRGRSVQDELQRKQEELMVNNCASEDAVDDLDGSAKYWVGKDYVNFIVKDFTNLEEPFDDLIDRTTTPRMPWHDIAVCVQNATAKDVAHHFIQRWNAAKNEKAKQNYNCPYLLPKSYNDCSLKSAFQQHRSQNVTCQVLRSASSWSCGFIESDIVEQSIHEAYVECITKAQHYIYIENQFFISLPRNNLDTINQISEALFTRIVRAHREKTVLRVFVVIPLLPGFEGEIGQSNGTSIQAITHWNYSSICRGKDSLLTKLKDYGIEDPSKYISFYGLRTHSVLCGEPVTELIYVHSKLMIVDDKIVVCGSANINDRSLLGMRDSEVAVIIEDEEFDDGIMNGKPFPSGKFSGSLRRRLFKEHLGLLGKEEEEEVTININDPVVEHFYKDVWYDTARLNTEIYENVFHCIPSDKVRTFADLKRYKELLPLYLNQPEDSEELLNRIQGHLVLFPLDFMANEVLRPTAGTVEGIMPQALWT